MTAGTRDAGPIRHIVAPESLTVWFSSFCTAPADAVHFLGENGGRRGLTTALSVLPTGANTRYVVHSSHRSLERDLQLARRLRDRGDEVLAQSGVAAALGVDKHRMKRFFASVDIPTPPPPSRDNDPGVWVVKRRDGTQSQGIRLVRGTPPAAGAEDYVERFVPGEEYSVVAYSDGKRFVTFPVVGKGPSTPDLVPPWRRVRTCPAVDLDPVAERRMVEITERIAVATRSRVWLEVEFVLGSEGEPLVLEINPRVAGTMRLAAMAADVMLFDLPARPDLRGHLPARRHGLEVPWSGPPVVDPAGFVFATSRLTVAAPTSDEARARVARMQPAETAS